MWTSRPDSAGGEAIQRGVQILRPVAGSSNWARSGRSRRCQLGLGRASQERVFSVVDLDLESRCSRRATANFCNTSCSTWRMANSRYFPVTAFSSRCGRRDPAYGIR